MEVWNASPTMETLYILECEDNKWYIGKTADVQRRFKQHTEGKGSEWTREYAPIRIAETRAITSPYDETNVTKEYMKKYGIDNVRGGAYAAVELPDETEDLIRHELRAASDACYTCGKKGHFANRCPNDDVWCCEYCNKEYPTKQQAISHEQGCKFKKIAAMAGRQKLMERKGGSGGGVCYRCGRPGHYSPDCYARTDVRGYELDD